MGRASVRFVLWLAGATAPALVACSFDVPEPLLGDGGASDGSGDSTVVDGADGAATDSTMVEGSPADGTGSDQLTPPADAGSDGPPSDGPASDVAVPDGSASDAGDGGICTTVVCNGICVDTDSNAQNCGACGRACATPRFPSGTCTAGVCSIVGASNAPSYVSNVSVDPYADAPTGLYAPSIFLSQGFASVAQIPFDSGLPSGEGSAIQFANALIANYEVPGQGTLVAISSAGTAAPIQYGYWNSTLSGTVPIAAGGALHIAFSPFGNVVYYSQAGTQTDDAGITQACLYAMFSSLVTTTYGCERAGPTSASPAFHFQLSPDGQRVYLLTLDAMLERIDLSMSGGPRTTIPYSAGGLLAKAMASGMAVDPGETYIYYFALDSNGSYLHQVQLSNDVDTELATLPGEFPAGVVADASNVYFATTSASAGTVMARYLPLGQSGGANFHVLGSVPLPAGDRTTGWVQTATEIFFVVYNQTSASTIYRIVKP